MLYVLQQAPPPQSDDPLPPYSELAPPVTTTESVGMYPYYSVLCLLCIQYLFRCYSSFVYRAVMFRFNILGHYFFIR